ncbi:MAG: hypothetical protein RB191_24945 [Terriglobia bacterium]|nr:hypothetical protein [Terriglobia bacterium]
MPKLSKSQSPQFTKDQSKSISTPQNAASLAQTLTPLMANNAKHAVKLRVARKLNTRLISLAHVKLLTCQVLGEMYEADMQLGNFGDAEGKPTVCRVADLDAGDEGLLICNEIIKSSLLKVEGGYVGQYFQLRAGDIREGKRYRDIDISLMEAE